MSEHFTMRCEVCGRGIRSGVTVNGLMTCEWCKPNAEASAEPRVWVQEYCDAHVQVYWNDEPVWKNLGEFIHAYDAIAAELAEASKHSPHNYVHKQMFEQVKRELAEAEAHRAQIKADRAALTQALAAAETREKKLALHVIAKNNEHSETLLELQAERDQALAERERWHSAYVLAHEQAMADGQERDRYRQLLSWVRDGLEHFTRDEDRAQVEHLTKAIDEALS